MHRRVATPGAGMEFELLAASLDSQSITRTTDISSPSHGSGGSNAKDPAWLEPTLTAS